MPVRPRHAATARGESLVGAHRARRDGGVAGPGLKLDDVRNEWHPDVQTAISRLSPEELSNRNKRLKRAMDLSLKHSELNKEAQAAVQPLVGYLPLERAREERLERCLPLQPPASCPPPLFHSLLSLLASPVSCFWCTSIRCGNVDKMCGNRVARGCKGLAWRECNWGASRNGRGDGR